VTIAVIAGLAVSVLVLAGAAVVLVRRRV